MKSLLIALLTPVFLLACGDQPGPSVSSVESSAKKERAQSENQQERKRIALVMKTLTNPFFVEMEKGARRAEKELGIDLVVKNAAQETSIEQQIQLVEDAISDKVDAIVIAPGDSHRVIPVLKKAQDRGIKIVNIDNRLDPEASRQAGLTPIPFVSVDNEKAAYEAAKFLVSDVSRPMDAVILEGIRSAENARLRKQGAIRAFSENRFVRVVASESANWKIDEAYTTMQRILVKHKDVRIVFASNDMMGLGALMYLRERGKNNVKVGSYDALEEAVAEIKSGRLTVTVDQQAAEQGFQGVLLANRLLKGEVVDTTTLINTRLITAKSLQ